MALFLEWVQEGLAVLARQLKIAALAGLDVHLQLQDGVLGDEAAIGEEVEQVHRLEHGLQVYEPAGQLLHHLVAAIDVIPGNLGRRLRRPERNQAIVVRDVDSSRIDVARVLDERRVARGHCLSSQHLAAFFLFLVLLSLLRQLEILVVLLRVLGLLRLPRDSRLVAVEVADDRALVLDRP